MKLENIIYTVEGGKAYITFNRPRVHNALSSKMIKEIISSLNAAEEDEEVRVIILQGNGKSFCSGDDIITLKKDKEKALGQDPPVEILRGWMCENGYENLIQKMRETPKPIIASVKGHALAAGCDILLASDFRVISESANMGLIYVTRALVAGILTIIYHVGLARATELLFTGETFDGKEAQRMGIVNVLSTDETLKEDTKAFAEKLVNLPTASIGIIKQGLYELIDTKKLINTQMEMWSKNIQTYDFKEGGNAFSDRRAPEYKGY